MAIHGDSDSFEQVQAARQGNDNFFAALARKFDAGPKSSGRVREANVVPDTLSEELGKLANILNKLAGTLSAEEEKIELAAVPSGYLTWRCRCGSGWRKTETATFTGADRGGRLAKGADPVRPD